MPLKFLFGHVQNCIDVLFLAARFVAAEHGAYTLAMDQRQEGWANRSRLRLVLVVRGGSVTLEWQEFNWKNSRNPRESNERIFGPSSILTHQGKYPLSVLRRMWQPWENQQVEVTEMRCRAIRARLAVFQSLLRHFRIAKRTLKVEDVGEPGWDDPGDLLNIYVFHGIGNLEMPQGDRNSLRTEVSWRDERVGEFPDYQFWRSEMSEDISPYLNFHLDQEISSLIEIGKSVVERHNNIVRNDQKEHFPDYAQLEAHVVSTDRVTRFEWRRIELFKKDGKGGKRTYSVPMRRCGGGYLLRTLKKNSRAWEFGQVILTELKLEEIRWKIGVFNQLKAKVAQAAHKLEQIAQKEHMCPDWWQLYHVFNGRGADPMAHFLNQKVKRIEWR